MRLIEIKELIGIPNEIDIRNAHVLYLTDGIFETGAYEVPSKSQNPSVLGQGGPSNTQCSKLS